MWLKCQLCRTIALNLVLSKTKRKSELELDRKVPNSTFWTRGLAANPDNLSNPALIIPSLEHSIVIELNHLIELISEMWLRFPRFLPAVPSSDIFVVYPLRARNPPWQLDSHTREEKFVSGKLLPVGICKCAAVEIQKGQLDKSELARVEFIGWDNNVEPLQEL